MAEKGRIALYKGLGQPLEIKEYPVPEPEPGAILIKISMANICGSDLHWWRGDLDLVALGAPMPMAQGHEAIGKVAKLGEGVSTDSAGQPLAVGDRVVYRYFYACGRCPACLRGKDAACPTNNLTICGPAEVPPHFVGAYADYYYLRPNHVVFKVPDDVTDQMAAPVNCALCQVLYGLEKVDLTFGETVVIQGAGGLGINATAVAKEMGAHKVIVIDGITERLELAKAFGADELIDMRECQTPEERVQRVRELTGGWGADVVAELVGFPRAIPEGLDMLAAGGRYLEIGNISPGLTFEVDPSMLVFTSKSIIAVITYGRDTLKKALDFLSRTKVKYPFDKILSHSYPLEEINKAFEEQDKGFVSRSAIVP
ncbi:MAG: zinc-binding dehydrogenase [Dehalococcoidia bacterium]|nr:zinc-binding dehydrogenase [Dehalococcoidia bacterium]